MIHEVVLENVETSFRTFRPANISELSLSSTWEALYSFTFHHLHDKAVGNPGDESQLNILVSQVFVHAAKSPISAGKLS